MCLCCICINTIHKSDLNNPQGLFAHRWCQCILLQVRFCLYTYVLHNDQSGLRWCNSYIVDFFCSWHSSAVAYHLWIRGYPSDRAAPTWRSGLRPVDLIRLTHLIQKWSACSISVIRSMSHDFIGKCFSFRRITIFIQLITDIVIKQTSSAAYEVMCPNAAV